MLLLTTTTVTVTRADETGNPFDDAPYAVVARNLPAHIVPAAVRLAQVSENATQPLNGVLLVDNSFGLLENDRVMDDLTGIGYIVAWVRPRTGLGLDYQHCGLLSNRTLV